MSFSLFFNRQSRKHEHFYHVSQVWFLFKRYQNQDWLKVLTNAFCRSFNILGSFMTLSEDFPFNHCMFVLLCAGLDQHPVTVIILLWSITWWVRRHRFIYCYTGRVESWTPVLSQCLFLSPPSVALLVECLLGNPEQTAAVCSLFVNDGFLLTSTIDNRSTPVGLTQAG